ncbi:hypothetical protein J6590_054803 [Homalodisca vitripennis]|nr:hypothetical protein J6590_054803 [Homalodisca vitripennis]
MTISRKKLYLFGYPRSLRNIELTKPTCQLAYKGKVKDTAQGHSQRSKQPSKSQTTAQGHFSRPPSMSQVTFKVKVQDKPKRRRGPPGLSSGYQENRRSRRGSDVAPGGSSTRATAVLSRETTLIEKN